MSRDIIYCEGFELYQYDTDDVQVGFLSPCYRLTAPDGTGRNVSADRLKDALEWLFEESA
jgi:hypothetical protein